MKTNRLILIALVTSTTLVSAAKPGQPVAKPGFAIPHGSGSFQPVTPGIRSAYAPNRPAPAMPRPATVSGGATVKPGAAIPRSRAGASPAATGDRRLAGFTGNSGAANATGRGIAGAFHAIDVVRGSLPAGLRQFGVHGTTPTTPGFATPNFGDEGAFGRTSPQRQGLDPLARFQPQRGGVKDLRGAVSQGRREGDTDTDGSWNLGPYEYMNPDGSRHVVAPGANGQSTTQHYAPDGKYTGRSDSQSSLDHTTVQHHDSEGHHTSTVVVERRNDGSERKTVYREGQAPEITHSDDVPHDGAGDRSTDRNPTEGASLGGAAGPRVRDVIGLKPLDLLRQDAEARETTRAFSPRTRDQMRANQVRPDSSDNATTPRRNGIAVPGAGVDGTNPEAGGGTDH